MAGLSALVLAIEHATRKRDEIAKQLAQINRSLGFAQDQLGQLQSYAGDTDAKWVGSAHRVLSTELVRHHYQFMSRLQNAISLQSGVVNRTREQFDAAKASLLQAEFRVASLSQVLKARQDALRLSQQRLEQRQTDEFAAMLYARARTKTLSGEAT